MLNSMILLIVCIILISLSTILIILFMKQIKSISTLTEELRKEQKVLYTKIESNLDDKNYPKTKVKPNDNKPNENNTNLDISSLKSSKVSQQELFELIKDKEPVFKKEVIIHSKGEIKDLNIDISQKTTDK